MGKPLTEGKVRKCGRGSPPEQDRPRARPQGEDPTLEHGVEKMPTRPFLKPAMEEAVASGWVQGVIETLLGVIARGMDVVTCPVKPRTRGELFRFMRIKAGYLLRDVARLTGTSIPYARALEQDETPLKEETDV